MVVCLPCSNQTSNVKHQFPVSDIYFKLKITCSSAFCPEEGGVVQQFTPEQTTTRKQSFEPNLGPSAVFLLNYNKVDGIVGNTDNREAVSKTGLKLEQRH